MPVCPECGEPLDPYGYCEACGYLADDEPLDEAECWLLTHPLALILDR